MPRSVNPYYSGPPSDHFDGLRFFNPDQLRTDRSWSDLLRWKLTERRAPWPSSVPVRQVVPPTRVEALRVTIVGHATALIQAGGLNVLTDPVWSKRAGPLWFGSPKRVCEPGISFDRLPPIDAVLLSHNHYDHLDVATLRRLNAAHHPLIVTPRGNDTIVQRAVPGARITSGDWWARIAVADGAEVTIVPSYHWSARGLRDRRMALWSGFMLRTGSGLVYFAGDTGYADGSIFREMRRRVGRPEIALIPIGAYAPRWFMRAQHADPEEAVRIMVDLDAAQAIGLHWGVFRLTDECRDEPRERLRAALRSCEIAEARFPAAEPGLSVCGGQTAETQVERFPTWPA